MRQVSFHADVSFRARIYSASLSNRSSGTGVPPATLAEFTFTPSLDWYDISNVDGSNLPMSIKNNKKCKSPVCKTDINKSCPAARKYFSVMSRHLQVLAWH